ncbi:phosphotriesterase [Pseudonocardiaceae bacterium YIM PH 21723]|nr:phosphotriesterase [Pseudonocardiaceae bacterium YIM PH 21723]
MIRTVLGDIPSTDLGVCDAHDHLFLRSPLLPGQELADPGAALTELRSFAALGGGAVVQWTPWGMGRRLAELPALSRESGVHIIVATGLHQAKHYEQPPKYEDLADLFVHELTTRNLGLIKTAGAYHRVDDHTRRVLVAAAEAHHRTGVPIAVHLEGGTAALEILNVLRNEGVPADRVILGHLGRFPDERLQRQAAEQGPYLAFDGPSRSHHTTDWRLIDQLEALTKAGHEDQLLLGGDTVTATARSTSDGPGMQYLLSTLKPRLDKELGPKVAEKIYVTNPANALSL